MRYYLEQQLSVVSLLVSSNRNFRKVILIFSSDSRGNTFVSRNYDYPLAEDLPREAFLWGSSVFSLDPVNVENNNR
jgi:hypothetical protein